uniref:Uncharacterized protein n=1 Tax=Zea mays TaxID=4577 RepID=C4J351_MAIZE|nr:unknown [Zea mays]
MQKHIAPCQNHSSLNTKSLVLQKHVVTP